MSPTNPVVPIGEVKISGICGDAVVCPLIRIKVHPHSTDDSGLFLFTILCHGGKLILIFLSF